MKLIRFDMSPRPQHPFAAIATALILGPLSTTLADSSALAAVVDGAPPAIRPPAALLVAAMDSGEKPSADAGLDAGVNRIAWEFVDRLRAEDRLEEALAKLDELAQGAKPDERAEIARRRAKLLAEQETRPKFDALAEALGGDAAAARKAEEALWNEPELAARAIARRLATGKREGPRTKRSLDMLRRLREPAAIRSAVNSLLGVELDPLSREALSRLAAESQGVGLGKMLLDTAVFDSSGHRPNAAWELLGVVPDPPAELVPQAAHVVDRTSGVRPSALYAMANAARVNRQEDVIGMRNYSELTDTQAAAIAGLPAKLAELREIKPETDEDRALVAAANDLSAALGLVTLPALANVKLLAATTGREAGEPSVLLDGDWSNHEPAKNWRPRTDQGNWIVLDLGAERLVEGVRLWNYNVRGQGNEAWKSVDVYVGDDPSSLRLTASGVVARASTRAEHGDYGTTIVMPQTRGRFVRLVCRSSWSGVKSAGLNEVQILGRD